MSFDGIILLFTFSVVHFRYISRIHSPRI